MSYWGHCDGNSLSSLCLILKCWSKLSKRSSVSSEGDDLSESLFSVSEEPAVLPVAVVLDFLGAIEGVLLRSFIGWMLKLVAV